MAQNKKELYPFSLARAIRGDKIVTGDGDKVTFIGHFENEPYPIHVSVDWVVGTICLSPHNSGPEGIGLFHLTPDVESLQAEIKKLKNDKSITP